MPLISVCLTPKLAALQDFRGKITVVVDVLRATTTIVTALEYGVKSILPVETVEQCRDFQKKGYIGAAERGGKIVDGFRLGNSPFDYLDPRFAGKKVVFTTTNGTKAINMIAGAEKIIFGAFVNIQSITSFLYEQGKEVVVVCAGWEDEVNLEDTLFTGMLIDSLKNTFTANGDPALLAQNLYLRSNGDLAAILEGSSHIQRLRRLGLQKDIDFCLTLNKFWLVPEMANGEIVTYSRNKELKL
jgi:2-phosphosulfolactate phosphatase